MQVIQLAQCPPPSVSPDASVLDAVRIMESAHHGALAVTESGRLVGVISERDVMLRVVGKRKDAENTKVREVMTGTVKTVRPDCEANEALTIMVANHIRHVVLVNEAGAVLGLASARDVFQAHVESLDHQVRTLEAYVGADDHGG